MWTSKNRGRYDRSRLRYPSDLTDDEWRLVEPLIPPGKTGGGKRTVIMREVVNGLMYVLSTGCQWRAVPKDLPPKSTIYAVAGLRRTGCCRGRPHSLAAADRENGIGDGGDRRCAGGANPR
jgi:transposase